MRTLAILGSTGSIGRQTLEVLETNSEHFKLYALTANRNYRLLIKQALKYKPKYVIINEKDFYKDVNEALKEHNIKVLAGYDNVLNICASPDVDIILMAIVGYAGMLPTLNAIKNKKQIALANKESLVVAGDIIMAEARKNNINILPVDSEHSAIFQCLEGEKNSNIEKIYLTASGGPFRGFSYKQLSQVTKKQALKHPNWNMGGKITIDSATMFNKGLEMIEAKWLFNLSASQIDTIVHPQSIVHSLVQFIDGSLKAQMGLPDMRTPIQYALFHPDRIYSPLARFSFLDYPSLTFEYPDYEVFRSLRIAIDVMKKGGNLPCIMNAANETAVHAFLQEKIKFVDIYKIVEETINLLEYKKVNDIDEYIEFNNKAVEKANEIIKKCK